MTDSYDEGESGLIINLDAIPWTSQGTRDWFALRRAVAEAQDGLVWITEGGRRIAAIVSKETAESLVRLRSALLAGDCEDFEPFFEAIKSL